MIFNSLDFAIFLPIVFFLYWFVTQKNLKLQNCLIIIASYFFYGWWDWRFLALIFISTAVDYCVGLGLSRDKNPTYRKILLGTSIIVNLGLLGFFKYYNFFSDNFAAAFSFLGSEIKIRSLNVILPVGISFYTFQTLSYTIDVYRRKMEATKDFIAFSAFVSFFPQLVAGPIERATHLLPQFFSKRSFDYDNAVRGMRLILWGLFKKIVIADKCAEYVDLIFGNSGDYSGSTLVIGAVLFAFQIYGDFSGYSDIAIGTSKLLGIDLMRNFAFPYFSRDIAEFWRRWHISLSSWFKDYVYIPLGGSRCASWRKISNIFIVFIVSGFWHGANWTFIIWGALHAFYFLPLSLLKRNRQNLDTVAGGKLLPTAREFFGIAVTFGLTVFSWIFFRADSVSHAVGYISGIFSPSLFATPEIMPERTLFFIGVLLLVEWLGREEYCPLTHPRILLPTPVRWAVYYSILISLFLWGGKQQQFIYFQF
jgi:alginate O-acetyltransferase complex protein AlgI